MLQNHRFLIIRLSSIGDVLHCTPVARALKTSLPSCHITWIVGQVSSELLSFNPYIDDLYIWPREYLEECLRKRRLATAWKLWQNLRKDLTEKHFDTVLDIHGLFLSGMIAIASNAKQRIGMSNTKELNSLFMTETSPKSTGNIHVIKRYLSVLRPLGINTADYRMTLALPPEDVAFADKFLESHNIKQNDTLITINPATSWPSKNWPPEYFAAVARSLSKEGHILLCGSPADRDLAAYIASKANVSLINAAGTTTLLQLASLLARSTVLITGDTGPLHMAIALETPTVSIFGATSPQKFGPIVPGHIILQSPANCAPCNKRTCPSLDLRCVHHITPKIVIAAVHKLLAKKKSSKYHPRPRSILQMDYHP